MASVTIEYSKATVETLGMMITEKVVVTDQVNTDDTKYLGLGLSSGSSKGHARTTVYDAAGNVIATSNSGVTLRSLPSIIYDAAEATGTSSEGTLNQGVSEVNFGSGSKIEIVLSGKFSGSKLENMKYDIGQQNVGETFSLKVDGNGVAIISIPFKVEA